MFETTKRTSLIVYLYYNRDARKVSKLGDISYHSRRMRYLVLYVDVSDKEDVIEILSSQKYVKKVVPSYQDDLAHEFVGTLENYTDGELDLSEEE